LLADLAVEAFFLKVTLLESRAGKVLSFKPAEIAGMMDKFETARAPTGRDKDMSLILDLVKAYAAFLKGFMQLKSGTVFETAHSEVSLSQTVTSLAAEVW
jgi:hypothetical protein